MVHPFLRRFASAILLLLVLLASLGQAVASEPDGQIHASSFVIESSGTPGEFYLTEPAICDYESTGDGNVLINFERTFAKGNPDLDVLFRVDELVYQRLADGSLQLVTAINDYNQYVNDFNWISLGGGINVLYLPAGPDYVAASSGTWFSEFTSRGWVVLGYSVYSRRVNSVGAGYSLDCGSPWGPVVSTNASSGIVNSTLSYTLHRYPIKVQVPITWDGKVIGNATTNDMAQAAGSFKIPAAPMGNHTIRWNYGHWQTSKVFTVKPRIKVIPSANLHLGDTVNISLRGFAAGETVRIRWKNSSGSWIQIAQVVTSSTGSKNIDVKVPSFAPIGANSVRGDGNKGGAAQTNAVTVVTSSASVSVAKASPTPQPTKTATPKPSPTSIPPTATPTATIAPTQTVEAPSATATPTETATPEPMDTPSSEPTAISTETVEPTVSGETG